MTESGGTSNPAESALVPIGAAALLGLVAFRCLVMISPDPSFDVDPLAQPVPWFGLGPGGSALCSIWILLAGTLVLLGERFSGRGLDRGLLLLWLLPLVPIVLHGRADATAFWLGVDWFAAASVGVVLAHACRAPGVRSMVLAGFLGVLGMLVIRGAGQLLIEHPALVDYFNANREAMLAGFGWEPGSAKARLYERRLVQPEATGWFGLANLFSGLMAIGLVLGVGSLLATGGSRGGGDRDHAAGTPRTARWLLWLLALAGFLVMLLVNGSKGAIGAVLLGLVVGVAPRLVPRLRDRGFRLAGVLSVAALAITLGAVLVRGLLGADALGGELSLLFRWQYLLGASSLIVQHPLIGIGPDGFQSAFLAVRPALSPEEPASVHNVIADWLVSLGVLGSTWICLLLLLAFRCGASRFIPGVVFPRQSLLFLLAIAVAGYLAMSLEQGSLTPQLLLLRLLGVLVALVVFLCARGVLDARGGPAVSWMLGATTATLLSLSVLDLLFVNPGTVALAWGVLGALSVARGRILHASDPFVALVPVLCGVGLFVACVRPQLEVDSRLEAAAQPLRSAAGFQEAFRQPPSSLAPISRMEALDQVLAEATRFTDPSQLTLEQISTLAPGSNDPSLIAADLLRLLAPELRREVVERLVACWDLHPRNLVPAWASIDQLRQLSAEPGTPRDERAALLLEALARARRLESAGAPVQGAITSAWIERSLAELDPDGSWEPVAEAFRLALLKHPGDPRLHAGLVEALRRGDDRVAEAAALERALLVDRRLRLDPLVRYPEPQRVGYEQRLEFLRQSSE